MLQKWIKFTHLALNRAYETAKILFFMVTTSKLWNKKHRKLYAFFHKKMKNKNSYLRAILETNDGLCSYAPIKRLQTTPNSPKMIQIMHYTQFSRIQIKTLTKSPKQGDLFTRIWRGPKFLGRWVAQRKQLRYDTLRGPSGGPKVPNVVDFGLKWEFDFSWICLPNLKSINWEIGPLYPLENAISNRYLKAVGWRCLLSPREVRAGSY